MLIIEELQLMAAEVWLMLFSETGIASGNEGVGPTWPKGCTPLPHTSGRNYLDPHASYFVILPSKSSTVPKTVDRGIGTARTWRRAETAVARTWPLA